MSSLLWRAYHEDDINRFKSLLGLGAIDGATPRTKHRKASTQVLAKGDVNVCDHAGLTILQRAVSSHQSAKLEMARLLLQHPNLDLYVQDKENGWTALHRALYVGNASIAKDILQRESDDLYQSGAGTAPGKGRGLRLTKMKDLEGHFPYDVYNATITRRAAKMREAEKEGDEEDSEDDESGDLADALFGAIPHRQIQSQRTRQQQIDLFNQERNKGRNVGDEFFAFGSNKNMTLGFGDEDDRQYPEHIALKRPDHLMFRFYQEPKHIRYNPETAAVDENGHPMFVSDLPALIRNKPIVIEDAQLSKLHSAILTSDPESNLYMCGVGSGGRLGMGDERTRFSYTCVETGALEGKHVDRVALGLNHTLAVTDEGDLLSWGINTWGVLGYSLPAPPRNQEPVNSTPRQIFGILKKEKIIGVAASAIHSVAFTRSALYAWGKNEGQLGISDADARSLEAQTTPRRVGVSEITEKIVAVSAINRATIVLLADSSVIVFTNYGYKRLKFPRTSAAQLLNSGFVDDGPADIVQIASGGETIAAISSEGDLYAVNLALKPEVSEEKSTTKPRTIKNNSLTTPQHIWALRKGNWDGVKSVDVSENGSIILCTKAGAVWRRTRRPNVKDVIGGEIKSKDFQFQRVPGLTNIVAVRANAFGGFAAIRKDKDAPLHINVQPGTLREDILKLFPLYGVKDPYLDPETWDNYARAQRKRTVYDYENPVNSMPNDYNVAANVGSQLGMRTFGEEFDVRFCTNCSDVEIPVHAFVLAARSPVLREALFHARQGSELTTTDILTVKVVGSLIRLEFLDFDVEALFNLAMYMYADTFMDIWSTIGLSLKRPAFHNNWKSVRAQLLRLAPRLKMSTLEVDVKNQRPPTRIMQLDFRNAIRDTRFMDHGDTVVELDGEDRYVYTPLMRQRCPFFEQLFGGRSGGRWLAGRRESGVIRVDLTHVEPQIFDYVMKYIYSDCGPEMFDDVVAADLDEFSHVVMDVLAISDELMLDRLGEICQHVLGQLANSRNIAYLLNEVEPLAVKALKDAGLEYICLQLETILDNHLLDDLDEEVLHELDEVIQANQMECLPVTMKNHQLIDLLEKYSELEDEIAENRERLLRDMDFRQTLRDEKRNQSSFRARLGSLEATTSSASRNAEPSFSPPLRPTSSGGDMMFPLEGDTPVHTASPFAEVKYGDPIPYRATLSPRPSQRSLRRLGKGKEIEDSPLGRTPPIPSPAIASPKVWSSAATTSSKIVMKDIFSETLSTPHVDPASAAPKDRKSSLSMELNAQREQAAAAIARAAPKMSQKERKRLAALQLQADLAAAAAAPSSVEERRLYGPWQAVKAEKVNLKDVGAAVVMPSAAGKEIDALKVSAIARAQSSSRRMGSQDTRFRGQSATPSSSVPKQRGPALTAPALTPHSKIYNTRDGGTEVTDQERKEVEAALQLSMQDIIDQQKIEAEIRREAGKRPLREIQEEQQFLEWWGEQERKVREEEAERQAKLDGAKKPKSRSRGKRGENPADLTVDAGSSTKAEKPAEPRPKQDRKPRERSSRGDLSATRGDRKRSRGRGGSSMAARGSVEASASASMPVSAPALASPATTALKAHAPEFRPNFAAPAFSPGAPAFILGPAMGKATQPSGQVGSGDGTLPYPKKHRGHGHTNRRGRPQGGGGGNTGQAENAA